MTNYLSFESNPGVLAQLKNGAQLLLSTVMSNRSPKGNMWSAVPNALLCMIVIWSERKQGSGPEGDEVLWNTGGLSFVIPSIGSPQALSGLKSALSGLKFTLSGLKSVLSGLKSALSGLKSALSGLESERADFRPGRADSRPERPVSGLKGQI